MYEIKKKLCKIYLTITKCKQDDNIIILQDINITANKQFGKSSHKVVG